MNVIGATCYYLGITILVPTVYFWLRYRSNVQKLRRLVFTNLDSAYEGGQFSRAEQGPLWGLPALDIAADMELYCEDLSGYDRNELMPHVYAWMKLNAEKVYPT